jgi:MFS transporter, putative metabolite:H+ symporter
LASTANQTREAQHTVTDRLDELPASRRHWRIVGLSGLGWAFDAMDVGIVSFALVALGRDWDLDRTTLGLIASVGFAGMFFGAAAAGRMADRYGRRSVFTATILIYSVATLLSGFAWGLVSLLVFRFIVGIGLGGELPVASTLVSEIAPARQRGRMLVLLESFWAWGWVLAAIVGLLVVPRFSDELGWRIAFAIGALPAMYAVYLRRAVPESPRWLAANGRHAEAEAIVRELERASDVPHVPLRHGTTAPVAQASFSARLAELWSARFARRTAMLWILWFGIVFSYYGVFVWLPTLLVDRGLSTVRSFEYVLITTLAQIPGYFSAAWLVERWGRKPTVAVYLLGSAGAALALGQAGDDPTLLVWSCLLSFFNLGAWGVVYTYTPEQYPTDIRGFGAGSAAAFGRLGGIIAPYLTPWLLDDIGVGQPAVFTMFTIVFTATAIAVLLLGEETRGQSLEQITERDALPSRALTSAGARSNAPG